MGYGLIIPEIYYVRKFIFGNNNMCARGLQLICAYVQQYIKSREKRSHRVDSGRNKIGLLKYPLER